MVSERIKPPRTTANVPDTVLNTLLPMTTLLSSRFTRGEFSWQIRIRKLHRNSMWAEINRLATANARDASKCPAMSGNVVRAAGLAFAPTRRCLRWSDDREDVARPEQHAAAGRALTADLAGHQPSIDGPHIDAAHQSDLLLRQKLLVVGVFRPH